MRIVLGKYGWLLFACVLMQVPYTDCHSQDLAAGETRAETGNPVPYGLSLKDWNKVQKIWKRNSVPVIHLYNNELTNGQILFMNDTLLVLWADAGSFYNPYERDSLLKIIKGDSIGKIMAGRFVPQKFWDNGLFWFPLVGLEDEEKRINSSTTGQVYTLPSQKISPSSFDITVGLHLHF